MPKHLSAACVEANRAVVRERRWHLHQEMAERVGQKFGKLTLLSLPEYDPSVRIIERTLDFRCECGEPVRRRLDTVLTNPSSCCNKCYQKRRKTVPTDYIGSRQGSCVVIEQMGRDVKVRCDCGEIRRVHRFQFLDGCYTRCGSCAQRKRTTVTPKVNLTPQEEKQVARILESRKKYYSDYQMGEIRAQAIEAVVRDRSPELQWMVCHGGTSPTV